MEKKSLSLYEMRLICDIVKRLEKMTPLAEALNDLEKKGYRCGGDLGREIIRLERQLSVEHGFFIKCTNAKGGMATQKGRELADALKQMLIQYETGVKSLLHIRRPRVVIGMTNWVTTYLMTTVLLRTNYLDDNPNTDLKILEGEADDLQQLVKDYEIDFALGPKTPLLAGITDEHLCRWRRVLRFRRDMKVFDCLRNLPTDLKAYEECLQESLKQLVLLVPLRRVMPDLDRWLPKPPTEGRIIKLPQAAIRREWAQQGLGVAVVHEELHDREDAKRDDAMESVALPEAVGWTEMCFYFRGHGKVPEEPTPQARDLIEAIRETYANRDH